MATKRKDEMKVIVEVAMKVRGKTTRKEAKLWTEASLTRAVVNEGWGSKVISLKVRSVNLE